VIFGEYLTGLDSKQSLKAENAQHIAMYASFFLTAIIQLVEFHQCSPLPSMISLLYAISFAIEALLMQFHLHQGSHHAYEQHLHRLLALCAIACSLSCIMEHMLPYSLPAHLGRPLFCLQQGVWFVYIAFQLYSPSSRSPFDLFTTNHHHPYLHHHLNESKQIMLSTAHFCGLILFNVVFVYFMSILKYHSVSFKSLSERKDQGQSTRYALLDNESV
jgi:hypothetical protein